MPLMTLDVEVPAGWEPVAYRVPRPGEMCLSGGLAMVADASYEFEWLILRPAWQWPEHIPAGTWYCRGKGGMNFLSVEKPEASDSGFRIHCECICFDDNQATLMGFTPPPCDDWTKSLRQKPEGK